MTRCPILPALLLLVLPGSVRAQAPLPLADAAEWAPLRKQCRLLAKALEEQKTAVSPESITRLRGLLDREPADQAAVRDVQKLLDPFCLLAVTINPESRVKALRGPARAALTRDQPRLVLVKVINDAGITPPLGVSGPGLLRSGKTDPTRWLHAELLTSPFGPRLTGRRLEYRLLKLTSAATGKREATFQLDAGQGTQDLGFRAEIPVLFTIQPATAER